MKSSIGFIANTDFKIFFFFFLETKYSNPQISPLKGREGYEGKL